MLKPYQVKAANMLDLSLAIGGHQTFTAPPGTGKTLVLAAALKPYPGKVLVLSRLSVLKDQTVHIFAEMEVGPHVQFYLLRDMRLLSLDHYDLIVATEDMRDTVIDHRNILRIV